MTDTKWIAQHAAEAGETVRVVGQNANGTADLSHWAGVTARCDLDGGEEVDIVEIDGYLFATDRRPDFSVILSMTLKNRSAKTADMLTNSNAVLTAQKKYEAAHPPMGAKPQDATLTAMESLTISPELYNCTVEAFAGLGVPRTMVETLIKSQVDVAETSETAPEQLAPFFPAKIGRINKLPRF